MSEHSKRIAGKAPQLVASGQTAASETNRSILRDLDPGAQVADAVSGRRWRLLPALAVAACAGAALVLLLQGHPDAPPHSISSDAAPRPAAVPAVASAALGEQVAPPTVAVPSPTLSDPAPSATLGPALIQHTPPAQASGPEDNAATPQAAALVPALSAVSQPAKTAKPVAAKKPRSAVSAKPQRSAAASRKATVASASQSTQKAAERDVDIITAIVKDIR